MVDKEPLSTNNSILIKLTCEFVEVYKNLCQQLLVLIKSQYMYITRNIYHYQYIETIQAWNSVLNYSNILIKILLFCCLGLTVLMSGQIDVYLVMAILKLLCTSIHLYWKTWYFIIQNFTVIQVLGTVLKITSFWGYVRPNQILV